MIACLPDQGAQARRGSCKILGPGSEASLPDLACGRPGVTFVISRRRTPRKLPEITVARGNPYAFRGGANDPNILRY